jgi:hypothetical protein
MFLKALSVAVFSVAVGPFAAQAQTVAQIGGPAENPPAGFKGQQYVDSRGCVFLKAGYGGRATWVPRVSRDRKVLCGLPPSSAARAAIEMAEDAPAVAPAPAAVAKAAPLVIPVVRPAANAPMETIASLPQQRSVYAPPPVVPRVVAQPAPDVETAPRQTYEVVAGSGVPQGKIGCYSSAPVPQRVRLTNGGTAVVCTRGDGSLSGWRPPIYADGARVGASLDDQRVADGSGRVLTGGTAPAQDHAAADAAPATPRGYKAAWTDDRLNPNRGRGTATGRAAQDQIWTPDVPAQLVADQGKKKKGKKVTVSTRNAATEPVQPRAKASGKVWLQVGTFGVPANAQGAAQRLSALGLPVAKSRMNKGGKALEIVLAGPFGSTADAQAALSKARNAGFGDAFLR